MASHPGPTGPGAANKIPPPRDDEVASTANGLSSRGPKVAGGTPSFVGGGKRTTGTTGDVGAAAGAGTRTQAAVQRLLEPGPGAFQEVTTTNERSGLERTRTVTSTAERERQRQVRSLRAGGPRGSGFFGVGSNPETGLTEAVGATPTSGRTRGAVATGGTAGGRAPAGEPSFAVGGNFRSGVIGKGLFLDTTGLSAIDKLNPRG